MEGFQDAAGVRGGLTDFYNMLQTGLADCGMLWPEAAAAAMPGPKADQTPLVDVASWVAAQGALAAPLADLALLQGRLMARLAQGPAGWRLRLALQDVVDLSCLAGDRVPMERPALWMALRLSGDADDN